MKLLTIITATYNAESVLGRCIDAIRQEKTPDLEFVIVDGNSKDRTLQIIQENSDVVDNYISENDKGIYDAWNKGINIATGKYVLFLGADDCIYPGAIKLILDKLHALGDDYDIISSKVTVVDKNGMIKGCYGEKFDYTKFVNKKLSFAHPGMLHNRKIFDLYGGFSLSYKIVSDSEFFARNGMHFNSYFFDVNLVKMEQGGMSVSHQAIWESYRMRKATTEISSARNLLCSLKLSVILELSKFRSKLGI